MKTQKYKRGQIWWYNNNNVWDGGTYNQGKSRPVIIVSNEMANANSNTLIAVPCTTQDKKAMPTHIEFDNNGLKNTAMAECLMSVAIEKLGAYITTIDEELMEKLEGCILVALGMREAIRENAVKRIIVHNTDGQSKPNLFKENGAIKPDIDYTKKDLALTLKMVEDAKKVTATDLFSAKLEQETKSEPKPAPKNKALTMEEKKQFLKDYETKTKKYMMKKYNLKSEACLFNKAYKIRKQLNVKVV